MFGKETLLKTVRSVDYYGSNVQPNLLCEKSHFKASIIKRKKFIRLLCIRGKTQRKNTQRCVNKAQTDWMARYSNHPSVHFKPLICVWVSVAVG